MEVICGLFVSHYRAADLQIRAGSNTQDPVQCGHWRKHGRCYCAAGWKEVERKVCREKHLWITCVLRMQLNLKRWEQMNVQNMCDYLSSPILATWGSCGRPGNSWTVSSATKKATASSSQLNSSFNSASTFGWYNLWGCNFETLQSTQWLHHYPSPALWSWSCTPPWPPNFPDLCSYVRGCPIELSK